MATDPSLISVTQAREFVGVRGNAEDRFLGELARASSLLIEELTDRRLRSRTYASGEDDPAVVLNGSGTYRLRLPEYPVTAVSAVEFLTAESPETWDPVSLSDYPLTIDPAVRGLVFFRNNVFPAGFRNVRVSFTAGYVAPYPDDLVAAAREILLALYRQKDKQLAGVASRTFDGQTVTYDLSAIPEQAKLLVQPYVRAEFV